MAKFCGKCGTKLSEKTNLCPKCGLAASTKSGKGRIINTCERKNNAKAFSARRKRLVILLLGFLVAVIGSIGALIVTNLISIPVLSNVLVGKNVYEEILTDALSGQDDVSLIDAEGNQIGFLAGGETSKKILASISFEIDEVNVQDENHIATVRFTVPDIVALSKKYVDLEVVDTDFLHWLQAELDEEYHTIEISTQLIFVKREGKISLLADENLYNALTGGALEFFTEKQESAYESLKGAELE